MPAPSLFRSALVLGLLSAVGPFAIDMYLPALPEIARDLAVPQSSVQLTLTLYFVAFGVAQLIYGPLADQVGRKPPLYIGMAIFIAGSIGAALAGDVGTLTAWRMVQGLGAAAVMVVPRSIIRDMYTGPEATRMMATIMLVISVSPMLAPLAGSGILVISGWRTIFWVLCGAALISLALIHRAQPETLAPENRVPVNFASLMRGARVLLRDPVFMGLTFVGSFGFASFFVFIAAASFVYTGEFGLTPTGFSLAFAVNAIGFFAASQAAGPLGMRFGMVRVMQRAILGFAGFTCTLAVLVALGASSLAVIMAFLFLANACLGLVIPTVMVMALDPHGRIAGLASSLGGTLQMLTGGLIVTLAGPFFGDRALPMVVTIAVCALLALATSLALAPRLVGAAAPAA